LFAAYVPMITDGRDLRQGIGSREPAPRLARGPVTLRIRRGR